MKATVEYKGEQVTIDIPDAKLEELIAEKKPRTGYERAERGGLSRVVSYGEEVMHKHEDGDHPDGACYSAANYYTDERLVRENARADTLMRRLRRYAAEHGGIPSQADWLTGMRNWTIEYDHGGAKLRADDWGRFHLAGAIYFSSNEARDAAINEFRDVLAKACFDIGKGGGSVFDRVVQ